MGGVNGGFVWLGTGILESREEVSDSAELCSATVDQCSITREMSVGKGT
jgi:hypothetical protein